MTKTDIEYFLKLQFRYSTKIELNVVLTNKSKF